MSTAPAVAVRPDDLQTTATAFDAAIDDIRAALRRVDDTLWITGLNDSDPHLDPTTVALDTATARNRLREAADNLQTDSDRLVRTATEARTADRCDTTTRLLMDGLTASSALDAANTIPKAQPVVTLAHATGQWANNHLQSTRLARTLRPNNYPAWRAHYLTAGYRGPRVAAQARSLAGAVDEAPTALARLNTRYPAISQTGPLARLGASPAGRTTARVGGRALGALSVGLDGYTAYRYHEADDHEMATVYGLRTVGGAVLLLSTFPPLAVAGAVIVAGTLIYEYRDHIVDGAQYLLDKHNEVVESTRQAIGDAANAVADTVDHAVNAAADTIGDRVTDLFRFET